MAGKGGIRSTSFKPGQSGNPKGRPKIVRELRDMAREHTEEALKALLDVIRAKKASHTAKVAAAQVLLDRGYGKATQHIEANVSLLDRMTTDEQRSLAAALEALARDEGDDAGAAAATHH